MFFKCKSLRRNNIPLKLKQKYTQILIKRTKKFINLEK